MGRYLFRPHLESTLPGKNGTKLFQSFSGSLSTGKTHSTRQYIDDFLVHVVLLTGEVSHSIGEEVLYNGVDTDTINIELCSFRPDISVFSATIPRSGQKSHKSNGNPEEESTEHRQQRKRKWMQGGPESDLIKHIH